MYKLVIGLQTLGNSSVFHEIFFLLLFDELAGLQCNVLFMTKFGLVEKLIGLCMSM